MTAIIVWRGISRGGCRSEPTRPWALLIGRACFFHFLISPQTPLRRKHLHFPIWRTRRDTSFINCHTQTRDIYREVQAKVVGADEEFRRSEADTRNHIVVDALSALASVNLIPLTLPSFQPRMASATVTTQHQIPLASYSPTRPTDLGRRLSFSSITGARDEGITQAASSASAKSQLPSNSNMSFTMSQGSQNNGLMLQPGSSFRHYADTNGIQANGTTPQIYSVGLRIFFAFKS